MLIQKAKTFRLFIGTTARNDLDLALGLLYLLQLGAIEQKNQRGCIELRASLPAGLSRQKFLQKLAAFEEGSFQKKIFRKKQILKFSQGKWRHYYQKFLQPFLFLKQDKEIWVDPSGKVPQQRRADTLYIHSSLAFGTGAHATTQLSAQLLADALKLRPAKQMLDMGCGTGILAFTARKLGVKKVLAIDIDTEALAIAKFNAKANHLTGLQFRDHLRLSENSFPLITANIIRSTLIELKPILLGRLQNKGYLILSGLLYADLRPILSAYRSLKVIKRCNLKGWSALLLQKI